MGSVRVRYATGLDAVTYAHPYRLMSHHKVPTLSVAIYPSYVRGPSNATAS